MRRHACARASGPLHGQNAGRPARRFAPAYGTSRAEWALTGRRHLRAAPATPRAAPAMARRAAGRARGAARKRHGHRCGRRARPRLARLQRQAGVVTSRRRSHRPSARGGRGDGRRADLAQRPRRPRWPRRATGRAAGRRGGRTAVGAGGVSRSGWLARLQRRGARAWSSRRAADGRRCVAKGARAPMRGGVSRGASTRTPPAAGARAWSSRRAACALADQCPGPLSAPSPIAPPIRPRGDRGEETTSGQPPEPAAHISHAKNSTPVSSGGTAGGVGEGLRDLVQCIYVTGSRGSNRDRDRGTLSRLARAITR